MSDKVVIVVEGLHDESRIKQLNKNYLTVSVGGLMIRKDKIKLLKELSKNYEIILFFDADFPGNKIRNLVSKEFPKAKQAYLSYQKSKGSRNKVGVEHAKLVDIDKAISKAVTIPISNKNREDEKWNFNILHELKLINHPNSRKNREIVVEELNIGHSNGKQLLNKLNALNIDIKTVKEVLRVT